ncbi:DUF3168 domain-containing protein [Oceanicaulis sp. MMSF_3324]|uniref:DUF3168 domain-containing protein n=1 Tax=Oceanicaulis sp. MMSF_3324 TaxID=3046702 RepID=UPI00273F4E47|nr:DUF3168 domain-containing protein [Oceanicaulis sp. MMSF_3324]
MSAEAAFQSGLLAHLKADAGVAAVLGERVFDLPRLGVRYPFLYLGRVESEAADASETRLVELRQTLLIRGRRDDADTIKQALGAIRAALDTALLALEPPHQAIHARVVYADLFSTPDSRVMQGLVRVRALLQTQGDTP